jgi:hypothetical protein
MKMKCMVAKLPSKNRSPNRRKDHTHLPSSHQLTKNQSLSMIKSSPLKSQAPAVPTKSLSTPQAKNTTRKKL